MAGNETGRAIGNVLCLSPALLSDRFQNLFARQILTHKGAAPLGDYVYTLTTQDASWLSYEHDACRYRGPAPVPLADYITSVDAQTITAEVPKREQLERAFRDISIPTELFCRLGPAVNWGRFGLFLYGSSGNGKSTLAERITCASDKKSGFPRP